MALFQPTNITPSTLGGIGNGTIDVSKDLDVSWQVNGNSPLVAYQIKIMQNDTDSTLKVDTGKTTLSDPFYGKDFRGNVVFFETIIPSATMTTAGMVNGYANGYKMTIKQWWNANDAIEQTSASYFITRSTPTISMGNIGGGSTYFTYQEYTFWSYYTQAQGDAIEWSRWELQAQENGKFATIDDTGYLYGAIAESVGTSIILDYYHNGFAVGVNEQNQTIPIEHRIKCTVQTVNGVQVDTGWKKFTTNMNSAHIPATLNLCVQRDTDSIKIEMPKNFPILGTATGAYSFEERGYTEKWLSLPYGTSIVFGGSGEDTLDIDESTDYSIYFKMSITDTSHVVDYLIADYGTYQIKFGYGTNGYTIKKGNDTLWSLSTAPASGTFFAIALTDTSVLFGINNNGDITYNSYSVNAWKDGATLQSLTINGPGVVRGMHVIGRQLTSIYGSLQDVYSFWEYPTDMQFYGRFDGALYTGFIDDDTVSLSIYRKASGSPAFKFIANTPLTQRTFYDYSALNQTTYEYFFMLMAKGSYENLYVQERHGIASVTPCWWNYTVLCCEQNMTGDYIVKKEYRFALDVASGSVGNNNSPTIFKNFTQYPLRQPVTDNYRSGTLSAFIGKVENDQYVDSVNLMDELYALSTSKMTKFLKTRKSQIFQIETSAPVSQQIGDKYAVQPSKIILPWVEVGDASKANILGESAIASGVPTFSVAPATMELQMEYAENSQMGADSFSLVDGDLYLNDPGIFQAEDFSLNSDSEVLLNTD